uniref:Survival motor neuron Tudor domain-containing protein n=1 Tax=Neobodo designis TaxID=312471 RepID=A0A7S1R2Y2_NEODS
MSGELLFQRGQSYAADTWDDSELVAAWNRQQSTESPTRARAALDTRRGAMDDGTSSMAARESGDSTTPTLMKPPVPAWADEATVKLLHAWYEAGYWSGIKAASVRP